MKILSVTIPACFLVATLFAQSTDRFRSITLRKKKGTEIVFSSKTQSVTIDIDSQEIRATDNPGELAVGDKVLTYTFTASHLASKEKTGEGAQKARLLSYMKGQLDDVKHVSKLHYSHAEHEWEYINNKIYLMWSYEVQQANGPALKQINLCTYCFENILNLNSSSVKEDNTDPGRALLISAAQTLKQNDFEIDFREQYKKLRAK